MTLMSYLAGTRGHHNSTNKFWRLPGPIGKLVGVVEQERALYFPSARFWPLGGCFFCLSCQIAFCFDYIIFFLGEAIIKLNLCYVI